MEVNNPHDKLLRYAFGIVQEVRIFLKKYIPKELLTQFDLRTLHQEDVSFLDEKLVEHWSDIVYSCKLRKRDDQRIQFSFLFEHKNYQPKFPHLQLMRYLLNGYTHQEENDAVQLSLIIPFVIAHTGKKWTVQAFDEYFKLPILQFKKFIPNFEYLLTDLFEETDESIEAMATGIMVSTLLLLKHHGNDVYLKTFYERILVYWKVYANTDTGIRFTKAMSVYIYHTFTIKSKEMQQLVESAPIIIKNEVMTLYQQAVQEGILKGIITGEKKGKKKGMEQVRTEVILTFIIEEPKMSNERIALLTRVKVEAVIELRKQWSSLKSQQTKIFFLAKEFEDWTNEQIAEFSKIPIKMVIKYRKKNTTDLTL